MPEGQLEGIPIFPEFKPLELSDRKSIEQFTAQFPPYSDFNFTSMWCWDTQQEMRVSQSHGNLIVKFNDYVDGHPFYSFLGINAVDKTTQMLLDYSREQTLAPELKLIPDVVFKNTQLPASLCAEDRDNFDYVLSVQTVKDYKGTRLMSKRNHVNHFNKRYSYSPVLLDMTNKKDVDAMIAVCIQWVKTKSKKDNFPHEVELLAIERLFQSTFSARDFVALGIVIDDQLVGFIISEILNKEYVIIHFQKADTAHKGVSEVLMQLLAQELDTRGIIYMNYEQDLGVGGLRKSKEEYSPVQYLVKYRIGVQ